MRYVKTQLSCILLYYADEMFPKNVYRGKICIFLWPEDGPQWPKHVVVSIINRIQDSCVLTYRTPSQIFVTVKEARNLSYARTARTNPAPPSPLLNRYRRYLLLNYSTCFGSPSRPSSGTHKTVVAASCTDLYQRLQLQFYVLQMMCAMAARNM